MRWPWVTTALTLACVAVYLGEGLWVHHPRPSLIEAFTIGPFRHGSVAHFAPNLALLVWAGTVVETQIGSRNTGALALACILLGGAAQAAFVGPNFIGISGVVLGLIAFAITQTFDPDKRWRIPAIGLIGFGIEAMLPATVMAVWVHLVSFLIGGFASMLNIFGGGGPQLKPMQLTDLSRVIAIIEETDEDDAAEAEESFLSRGCDNMFVFRQRGQIIGVTGFSPVDPDEAEDVAWLGWTYLASEARGQGLGREMFDKMLAELTAAGMRKLFIATSDYVEDGVAIYADAQRLYARFGAETEVTIPDFHAPGEAMIIMALSNSDHPSFNAPPVQLPLNPSGLRITGVHPAPDSETSVALHWQEGGTGLQGLEIAMTSVPSGQMAVMTLPSDISINYTEKLVQSGFECCGDVRDYYAPGLHQTWWRRPAKP